LHKCFTLADKVSTNTVFYLEKLPFFVCQECAISYVSCLRQYMFDFYRAMDFLSELFRNLMVHPDWSMSQVCTDSYDKSLKKWHGWLASSSFSVNTCSINVLDFDIWFYWHKLHACFLLLLLHLKMHMQL
jgi:hypothetical protein